MRIRRLTLDRFRRRMHRERRFAAVAAACLRRVPGLRWLAEPFSSPAVDEALRLFVGLVDSMTPAERANPKMIDQCRRRRIARGGGRRPSDVTMLLRMMEQINGIAKAAHG